MSRTPKPSPIESPEPPRPPNPPRPITAAVRRRSWFEPRVRFWAIACLAVEAITAWFFISQFREFRSEKRLIDNGVTVNAVLYQVANDTLVTVGHRYPPGSECTIRFQLNGEAKEVAGPVNNPPNGTYLVVGGPITLHVDPDDLTQWTERSAPEPLLRRLITGAFLVPAIIATALATVFLRRRTINTWRNGIAEAYAVIDTYHTALAPSSHAVHCAAASGRDQQVITVYLPSRLPRPKPGDLLWLIHPPKSPRASIAAAAYEG